MSKTTAPGMALQRFIESTLCEIADGYLGAMAIVDPLHDQREHSDAAPVGPIEVSFDLVVVGDAGGRSSIHVVGTENDDVTTASRIRFSLPLSLPPGRVAVVRTRPMPDFREPEMRRNDNEDDPADMILL